MTSDWCFGCRQSVTRCNCETEAHGHPTPVPLLTSATKRKLLERNMSHDAVALPSIRERWQAAHKRILDNYPPPEVKQGLGPDCYNCNCTTRCQRYA